MRSMPGHQRWIRHFVYRTDHLRTTWKFRFGLVAVVAVVIWLTAGWWTGALARSLACGANRQPADAIVIENFEADNYLVFERAGELRRAGLATRVVVPIMADTQTGRPNAVALGTAKVVADIARTGEFDVVATREVEPISLNTARDVERFAKREGVRSVIVVAPYFRSRRSALVYGATLGAAGIVVVCEPVGRAPGSGEWTATWHGIQDVVEQWLKLQYYRLYVLPVYARPGAAL